mgnify:CR=1 FL=1
MLTYERVKNDPAVNTYIIQADEALLLAKRSGRNRIELASRNDGGPLDETTATPEEALLRAEDSAVAAVLRNRTLAQA